MRASAISLECRTTDSLAYTIVKPWEIWGQERTDRSYRANWTQIASDLSLHSPPGRAQRARAADLPGRHELLLFERHGNRRTAPCQRRSG